MQLIKACTQSVLCWLIGDYLNKLVKTRCDWLNIQIPAKSVTCLGEKLVHRRGTQWVLLIFDPFTYSFEFSDHFDGFRSSASFMDLSLKLEEWYWKLWETVFWKRRRSLKSNFNISDQYRWTAGTLLATTRPLYFYISFWYYISAFVDETKLYD